MSRGIVVVGGNGSGKTTLGKRLAALLGYTPIDIEQYAFASCGDGTHEGNPYENPRSAKDICALLQRDLPHYRGFVLSAVNGDFGEEINSWYEAVVYMEAPLAVRMERLRKRSLDRFGCRVLEGGDLYEQEQAFLAFAASRSLESIHAWLDRLSCPVICVDGTMPVEYNAHLVQTALARF